jgi:predicted HAD superfamily Cof-like phosphohydrolase
MSQDWYDDVRTFMQQFQPDMIGSKPSEPPLSVVNLRMALLDEELEETIAAMEAGDLPGVADGLVDLIYVAIGAAISYGVDLRPAWDEVHRANLSKIGAGRDAAGKVRKPENFTPPDIAGILRAQGWEGGAQ